MLVKSQCTSGHKIGLDKLPVMRLRLGIKNALKRISKGFNLCIGQKCLCGLWGQAHLVIVAGDCSLAFGQHKVDFIKVGLKSFS